MKIGKEVTYAVFFFFLIYKILYIFFLIFKGHNPYKQDIYIPMIRHL